MLAACGLLAACTREEAPETVETHASNAATITVTAGKAGTRTAIIEQTDGFDFQWKAGDRIGIVEGCPALSYNACETYGSQALGTDTDEAVFSVTLADRENLPGRLSYTAFYPYDPWGNGWGIPNGYYDSDGNLFMGLEIPDVQYPTENSFDPKADLLLSKPVYYDRRLRDSDQLAFQFARVGTIVKMVLNGLPENMVVREGRLTLGFDAGYYMEYYPEAMLIKSNDGSEGIWFDYDGLNNDQPGITVGSDRSITVWLRCKSGETGVIDVGLNRSYYPSEHWTYRRRVSLRAKGQKFVFKEGGLTSFIVSFAPADVDNPDEESVLYLTNAAMDGVTVSWPASDDEDLAGYEAFLLDEDDNQYDFDSISSVGDHWEAVIGQGLPAGEYTLFLRALAIEHKVSQSEYLEKDLSVGIFHRQSITGESFPGSYYSDVNSEITYSDILFGYRNMSYGTGWNASAGSLPWAFWNKTPLHLGILRVTPRSGYEDRAFQVYASDEPFEDGLPAATVEPLSYNFVNGYKEFSLGGKKYFLMTGQNGIYLNGIYLEYYH